jgi:fructose-1,6-bisphosphatase I
MSARDPAEVVVDAFVDAAPRIADGLPDRRDYLDEANPSGEEQLAADVWANELLQDAIAGIDGVGQFASEEFEAVVDCGAGRGSGDGDGDGVAVTVDPLDGSSNLPTNNIVGAILGVYDGDLPCSGEQLVAAAYVVFGPLTTAVVAGPSEDGVTEYVLEAGGDAGSRGGSSGGGAADGVVERHVASRDLAIPEPAVYGFGGGVDSWTDGFAGFAEEIGHELKLRYGGAMVGDVNQVLHKGGLFAYPALRDRPEGKLRLVFEAAPMAYVMERAGGASTDGARSLLAVEPDELHQRTPVHLGNAELVERVEAAVEYGR